MWSLVYARLAEGMLRQAESSARLDALEATAWPILAEAWARIERARRRRRGTLDD